MIKPKDMTKIRILAPSKYLPDVIESLYNLKILHISDFKKEDQNFFDRGKPFKEASIYSQQLIDLRSMISKLKISDKPKGIKKISQAQRKFSQIDETFKILFGKIEKLKTKEAELLEEADNPLINLVTIRGIPDFKSLIVFTGTVKYPLEQRIQALTKNYILKEVKLEKSIAFILFIKIEDEERVKSILNGNGYTEHSLPKFDKSYIEKNLYNIRKELDELESQMGNLKQENSQFIISYEFLLTQLTEKAEVPLKFATSNNTFVAEGWIPSDKSEELKQVINEVTREKVLIEVLPIENPPTELDNPKQIKNFEFLTNMYSLPKNYELDPTILMFLIFPLFFGFMLGDVGYGLITFLAMLVFEKLSPSAKPLIRIVTMSSLATIAFGFVFGELFGHEFIHPLLNRVHDVQTMMLISVGIGVAHINLGFILGLINELKHHNFLEAFFRKGSWITLQISVAVFWLGYSYGFIYQITGAGMALVSILMIAKGEGILRIIEIPGILSNILSYIRLYAIGLASVALASIVNELASGLFASGGFSIIAGVFLLFIGHFINLLLGLIGPFLHSMRLHYVEFFQKFYEGGGYRYNPFGTTKIGGR